MSETSHVALNYAEHEGVKYVVSTIDRESSAMLGGRYAETMVWALNSDGTLGKLVAQGEASEGSRYTHDAMFQKFVKHGCAEVEP